jgi:hypothetical protein
MTKEEIDESEKRAFKQWLDETYKYPIERLNHFEHNLEVHLALPSQASV